MNNALLAIPASDRAGGPAPLAGGDLSVLIVEDHDFQRSALSLQLRSLGIGTVVEATDGCDALNRLADARRPFDLILSDLEMPNMDGMEFMRHLGATDSHTPVAISSSHDSKVTNSVQIMAQAYGVRLLGIIEKPLARQRLLELIAVAQQDRLREATQPAMRAPQFPLEEILAGLARDEFAPYFQAKADMRSGRIVGAEALARWRHPQLGLVSPQAFIDTLEAGGRIDDLTFDVLRKAAAACCRWRDLDLDLGVSVNLSLSSLADTSLADRIRDIVVAECVGPQRITLEITETTAMTDVAPALENLARLRLRGFGLSIDDFGTGFSSMQQLGRIAFTELKIDRGFVSRMLDVRESRAIVESSIDMAKRLNLRVVAEGVETEAEWQALRDAGCDLAQGYFLSKPLDEESFLELVTGAAS